MNKEKIKISKSKISKAGRGVFARELISKGVLIEECPVIVIPKKDYFSIKRTELRNYYFMWGKVTCAICLGFGSLYNHSYEPNATYIKDIKQQTVRFIALRKIKKGEEITVNYNYGNPQNKNRLWIKNIS